MNKSSGAIGIIWIIAFMTLSSNSPSSNRFITEGEAKFLMAEITRKKVRHILQPAAEMCSWTFGWTNLIQKSESIPWKSLLKCKPMYACLCCQFAYNFSATLLQVMLILSYPSKQQWPSQAFLPTYFRDELMIPLSMVSAERKGQNIINIGTQTCRVLQKHVRILPERPLHYDSFRSADIHEDVLFYCGWCSQTKSECVQG